MITIKCCATCRYWKDGICRSRDSYNTETSEDMWCPEWEELRDGRTQAETANES